MKYLYIFTAGYLIAGAYYFLQTSNSEFMIYVGVLLVIFAGVFSTIHRTNFPLWMLFGLSFWGLLHVLGGAITIDDHVLFAHKLYLFIDAGGELYILKYDQVVHAYLYGLVAVMIFHLLQSRLERSTLVLVALVAILTSIGIGGLNEIMEFIISLTLENGVGGYHNTMLDMCFNLLGSVVATGAYVYWHEYHDGPRITLP